MNFTPLVVIIEKKRDLFSWEQRILISVFYDLMMCMSNSVSKYAEPLRTAISDYTEVPKGFMLMIKFIFIILLPQFMMRI